MHLCVGLEMEGVGQWQDCRNFSDYRRVKKDDLNSQRYCRKFHWTFRGKCKEIKKLKRLEYLCEFDTYVGVCIAKCSCPLSKKFAYIQLMKNQSEITFFPNLIKCPWFENLAVSEKIERGFIFKFIIKVLLASLFTNSE